MKKLAYIAIMMAFVFVLIGCESAVEPIQSTPAEQQNINSLNKATVITSNEEYPITMAVWVPCAMDGAGEIVLVSGRLHYVYHTTINNTGGYQTKFHYQPKDLSGEGLSSGDKYQGTGVTQETYHVRGDSLPSTHTYINNFRFIGQGPGNNYLVHQTIHMTINANGEVTADVNNFSVECK